MTTRDGIDIAIRIVDERQKQARENYLRAGSFGTRTVALCEEQTCSDILADLAKVRQGAG